MPMIAIWTGVIYLVSLPHLTAADYGRPQIWIGVRSLSHL